MTNMLTSQAGTEFREIETHNFQGRSRTLPPDVIKRLTKIDNLRAAISVVETIGGLSLLIGLALWTWSFWIILPLLVLIAFRQQALFILAHDAAHYRLFSARWLNDLIGRSLGAIVGISMCTYRVVHRLHHNHLYGAQDPDIPLIAGYPRGRRYLIRKLLKDLFGLTAFKTYAYFFGAPAINEAVGSKNRPLDDTSPELRRAGRLDRWVVIATQVSLPILAFIAGYGWQYLILWALPLVTLLQPILRFRALCEHAAVPGTASAFEAARTTRGHKILEWLLFPHQVNYHLEHHLYPSIPHYNLPLAHAELAQRGLLANAEVRSIAEAARLIAGPA